MRLMIIQVQFSNPQILIIVLCKVVQCAQPDSLILLSINQISQTKDSALKNKMIYFIW